MNYSHIPREGTFIVFVRSRSPLARLIQFGMVLWQVIQKKRYPQKTYQHTDIVIDGWVHGATIKGIATRSLREAYRKRKVSDLRVFHLCKPDAKKKKLQAFIQKEHGTPYEFSNFWHHAMRIFTGKWSGKTGNEAKKQYYCIEFAATALLEIFPDLDIDPWQINPIEFLNLCDDEFKELTK